MTPCIGRPIVLEQGFDGRRRFALLFEGGRSPLPFEQNSDRSSTLLDKGLDKGKDRLALAWLITALGAAIFVTIQSFSYVNDVVRASGTTAAVTFDSSQMWVVSAFDGAWVVPALLALFGRSSGNWAMLILGVVLVVSNTLGGVFDGIRDGGHLVFLVLVAVTLPGVFAIAISWRHVQAR